MCWCRIELVLLGLLGLLCVVHVVSGMCGQDFPSTAKEADVVIQGKVLNVSKADWETGLYYAKIKIKKPVLKGTKIIKKMGKDAAVLTLGPFKTKTDVDNCFGPVKKGKTYMFALKQGNKINGVRFILQALPRRKTKKEYKQLKGMLCKIGKNCKSKKSSAPKIRKATGPKNTVKTGSKLTFKCYAKAKPNPAYRWYKDGVLLNPGKGLKIKTTKRFSKLQIRRSTTNDQGVYRCEATNPRGTVARNFSSFSIRDNPKEYRDDTSLCVTQTLCLHGGTCLYNSALDVPYCMCRPKWTGTRCEIMDAIKIHGHYSRQATLLYERTLIIVGLAIAVIVFIVICIVSYFLAKRKRKKFEAKRKRKHLRASNSVRMKDNATQSNKIDENFPPNKTYQPITHDTRSFFPGRDNGFDFEAAQRQPLLRHHGDDVDGPGPESRRRLVASSMYDNFDDPPTTTSPNRSSNVTGLTTAEVAQNPEMIEMSPMENRVVDPVSEATPLANNSHPGRTNTEEEMPYPQSDDSTIPLSQSSPISDHPPDASSSPIEIPQPFLDPELPPPPEDLDFEKYTAPPPPILPLSHSNSSPLRNTAPPNSTAPTTAYPSRFPTSNSMPIRLENDIDSIGDPNGIHSSLPHKHNSSINNPYANVPASNNDLERLPFQHPSLNNPSDNSIPSYETAVLLNGVVSDDGGDESDNDIVSQFANNGSNTIEDLHISEEEELGLSAENLPRGSFNSSARPSRQPSIDMDGSSDCNDKCYRRRRFSTEKQQSEDILHPEQFWKRSMLYGQSPRSQSLDMPSNDRVNGTGSNHLDSTVSENQNMKHDGHNRNKSGKYHHPDDVFDPSDDSTPWDPEQQQKQQQQSCNSNYSNLLDEERDRLNRLKDVCPDQPAIPI